MSEIGSSSVAGICSTALLVMYLGNATMRLAISRRPGAEDACVATFKPMAIVELLGE